MDEQKPTIELESVETPRYKLPKVITSRPKLFGLRNTLGSSTDTNLEVNSESYKPPSSIRVEVRHGQKIEYSDDPITDIANVTKEIDTLSNYALRLGGSTLRKANFYKMMNILAIFFVVIGAAIISGFAQKANKDNWYSWFITVLAILIATVRGLTAVFPLEQKSAILKESSLRAMKVYRDVCELKDLDYDVAREKLKKYHDKIDSIEYKAYANNLIVSNVSSGTKIERASEMSEDIWGIDRNSENSSVPDTRNVTDII
jgi:hypothetical protein